MYFKKINEPELYQGRGKKKNYFEGWYYKTVVDNQSLSFAFIPGISKNKHNPHAFIQVIIYNGQSNNKLLSSDYFSFDISDFSYQDTPFSIKIKNNIFTSSFIKLNLKSDKLNISADLEFSHLESIMKNIYKPNIMGPFAYIGFMECYHAVVSMNHVVSGNIQINDNIYAFNDGHGYIEKDWGVSFPKSYIWIQSNSFHQKTTSFMFSYATIPFKIFSFKGLIANLKYNQKEYRFATYNFTKIKIIELNQESAVITLKKGRYQLHIHANTTETMSLKSPNKGMMVDSIKEGLFGILKIELCEKNKLIYSDQTNHAGIEIMMKK